MPETLSTAALAALVCPHLDADPATLRFSRILTGKHNASYWVDSDRGRYVLRVAPPDDAGLLFYERRMMRQEPQLHALIRDRTRVPVAEVVGHDFGRTRIDRDYLLMTALPGVPLSDAPRLTCVATARALRLVGEHLRALHALTAPECLGLHAYGYLGPHRPMDPQPTWLAAFRVIWNALLDDVVASGCATQHEAGPFRDLLERYAPVFDRPVAPSLLHMDVWGQNILVDAGGEATGLVDFDRALWGDPEIEFAVLDYCGISEPPFWEGYGRERDESDEALIRQRFYLLYEVQKYMPIAVWRRKDPAAAMGYKRRCLSLAAELGLRL